MFCPGGFQLNKANETKTVFPQANQTMEPGKKAQALKMEGEKLRDTANRIGGGTTAFRLSLQLPPHRTLL